MDMSHNIINKYTGCH